MFECCLPCLLTRMRIIGCGLPTSILIIIIQVMYAVTEMISTRARGNGGRYFVEISTRSRPPLIYHHVGSSISYGCLVRSCMTMPAKCCSIDHGSGPCKLADGRFICLPLYTELCRRLREEAHDSLRFTSWIGLSKHKYIIGMAKIATFANKRSSFIFKEHRCSTNSPRKMASVLMLTFIPNAGGSTSETRRTSVAV